MFKIKFTHCDKCGKHTHKTLIENKSVWVCVRCGNKEEHNDTTTD